MTTEHQEKTNEGGNCGDDDDERYYDYCDKCVEILDFYLYEWSKCSYKLKIYKESNKKNKNGYKRYLDKYKLLEFEYEELKAKYEELAQTELHSELNKLRTDNLKAITTNFKLSKEKNDIEKNKNAEIQKLINEKSELEDKLKQSNESIEQLKQEINTISDKLLHKSNDNDDQTNKNVQIPEIVIQSDDSEESIKKLNEAKDHYDSELETLKFKINEELMPEILNLRAINDDLLFKYEQECVLSANLKAEIEKMSQVCLDLNRQMSLNKQLIVEKIDEKLIDCETNKIDYKESNSEFHVELNEQKNVTIGENQHLIEEKVTSICIHDTNIDLKVEKHETLECVSRENVKVDNETQVCLLDEQLKQEVYQANKKILELQTSLAMQIETNKRNGEKVNEDQQNNALIEQLNSEILSLKTICDEKIVEIGNLKNDLYKLNAKISEIETENCSLLEKINEFKQNQPILSERVNTEMQTSPIKVADIIESDCKNELNKSIEANLNTTEANIKDLMSEIISETENNEFVKVNRIETSCEIIEKEDQKLVESVQIENKTEINYLNEQLVIYKLQNDAIYNEKCELECENEKLRLKLEEFNANMNHTVNELSKQIESLTNEVTVLKEVGKELSANEEIDGPKLENECLTSKLHELDAQVKANVDLLKLVDELKNELNCVKCEYESLAANFDCINEENCQLKIKEQQLATQLYELNEKFSDNCTELNTLREENQKLKEKLEDYELHETEKIKFENLKNEHNSLAEEFELLKQNYENIKNENIRLNEKSNENQEVQRVEEVEESKHNIPKVQDETTRADAEVEHLESSINKQKTDLLDTISSENSDMNEKIKELNIIKLKLEEESGLQMSKIESLTSENYLLKTQNEDLLKKIADLFNKRSISPKEEFATNYENSSAIKEFEPINMKSNEDFEFIGKMEENYYQHFNTTLKENNETVYTTMDIEDMDIGNSHFEINEKEEMLLKAAYEQHEHVKQLNNEIFKKNEDIDLLNGKVSELNYKMDALIKENDFLKANSNGNGVSVQELESINAELLNSQRENQRLIEKFNDLSNEIELMRRENENFGIKMNENNEIVNQLNAEITKIKEENLTLKDKIESVDREINDLKTQNSDLKLKSDENCHLKNKIDELNDELSKTKEENEHNNKLLECLAKESDALKLENEDIKTKLTQNEDLNQRIGELNDELLKFKQDNECLNSKISSLNEDNNNLNEVIKSKSNENDNLFKKLDELNRVIQEVKDDNEGLNSKIESYLKEIDTLNIENNDFKTKLDENKDLVQKTDDLNGQITKLKSENESIKDKCKCLIYEFESYKIENETILRRSTDSNTHLQNKIEELKKQNNEAFEEVLKIKNENETLVSKINLLTIEISNMETLRNDLNEQKLRYDTLKEKYDGEKLSNALNQIEFKRLNDLHSELEKQIALKGQIIEINSAKIDELNEQIKNLNTQLSAKESIVDGLVQQKENNERELIELKSKLCELHAENEKLLRQLLELNEERAHKQTVYRSSTINESFMIKIDKHVDEKNEALSQKLDKALENAKKVNVENGLLKRELHKLKSQLKHNQLKALNEKEGYNKYDTAESKELKEKIQTLTKTNEFLSKQITSLNEQLIEITNSNKENDPNISTNECTKLLKVETSDDNDHKDNDQELADSPKSKNNKQDACNQQ